MCGIMGYCGDAHAAPLIIEGLRKLEYRGYDSFGVAALNMTLSLVKKEGRISEGEREARDLPGSIAIGHTRWATHGVPNDTNAHPHTDCQGRIAIVHNGIIENYAELKRELLARGHIFRSETDTEVIVHLIEEQGAGNLLSAVSAVLPRLQGSYAILVIAEGEDRIIAARLGSPLVLGIGDDAVFAASDMTPLLDYTQKAVFLDDGDIASLSRSGIEIYHNGRRVQRKPELIEWSLEEVRKGGFKHYMLKEIFEQPAVFSNALRATSREGIPAALRKCRGVTIVACGTSYHAGLLFRYLLEEQCGIPARTELASEFRYFTPPLEDLVIGITQSGETADTLSALKTAQAHNCRTIAIANVLGSSVTRLVDYTFYMRAGPEISVAATKSYIAQVAVFLSIINTIRKGALTRVLDHTHRAIEEALLLDLGAAVDLCRRAEHIFFVGRGPFYAVALEGALKMKEISYIHAEGYAAGEIKHGPFALLSNETPVVAICVPGTTHAVMLSNIKEMKARGTPMIVLGAKNDRDAAEVADVFIPLPEAGSVAGILSATVILQLLAYHTADALGRDIDKPRNLAKSVTVE